MKFSIYIDQLTMEYWIGKKLKVEQIDELVTDKDRYLNHSFDLVDAALVSLIQDMNPQNEGIRKLMYRGYFLVTLGWLNEQLPLLQMNKQGFYRRLRWLKMMGILECLHKTVSGNKTLAYYRLSGSYRKIRDKRHEAAEKAAKGVTKGASSTPKAIVPVDDGLAKSHSSLGHEPSSQGTSNESIKDSLLSEKTRPDAPFEGAPSAYAATNSSEGIELELQPDPVDAAALNYELELAMLGEMRQKMQKENRTRFYETVLQDDTAAAGKASGA